MSWLGGSTWPQPEAGTSLRPGAEGADARLGEARCPASGAAVGGLQGRIFVDSAEAPQEGIAGFCAPAISGAATTDNSQPQMTTVLPLICCPWIQPWKDQKLRLGGEEELENGEKDNLHQHLLPAALRAGQGKALPCIQVWEFRFSNRAGLELLA